MWWLALGAWILTAFSATAARCLDQFSRSQLQQICQRRQSLDRLAVILRRYDEVRLGMEAWQVLGSGLFLIFVLWVWLTGIGQANFSVGRAIGIGFTVLVALWAAVIWIPSALAQLVAASLVYFLWPFWQLLARLMLPAIAGARFLNVLLHRLAGQPEPLPNENAFEQEIRTIVSEGHRVGLLEEDAREMIESVIRLSDVQVSQIMVPRTDMVSIPLSLSWPEMLQQVIASEHTRIPVYDKNRDDIVGILHAKDLLPELAKPANQPRRPWTELLRKPYFVPETKPVDVLLEEFQRTRNHMAVVLDEYGGVAGIVTLEDILEEIVGEIQDEYDREQPEEEPHQVAPGVVEVSARMHIEKLNEQLHLGLPEDADYDTIGGFVFSELGHVPVPGESLCWNHLRITVLAATRRRIERLRIEDLRISDHPISPAE
ncbi:MAG: hemolysin family protein [Thermoguttaceae bacterium]|nr:hemolysin family protein [Thermoguttaceae bacterium]MDW8036653.1 hemolysin family protein [Thermoguttaceae bacterium]